MTDSKDGRQLAHPSDAARGAGTDNSLLPMLIGGLVLIVIGAIIVMAFV